ncbi:MAG: nucleotide sugar dehydrogenase [Chloroflexi bacterium]|nr:nucleotide sugar dehydrogenase [Chloroflexota bacterium]
MGFNKLCILGLGYIGLPTASTFATHGIQVIGVDTNPKIIEGLRNEEIHIHEPGLRTLVQAAIHSGNLLVRSTPEQADAFIIAVPTPFYPDNKKADMRYVTAATESIVPHLRPGNLVILESTSPPRTTIDLIAPILERSGLKAGTDFYLAYSPERVLPGRILQELIENARVIGGIDRISAEKGRDLYRIFVRGDIILSEATTAEMVKLMENTTRDINIAIANEFSRLADRVGIDVWEAIEIANRHPRINILKPGPGVGGHCISVDPWFLVEAAPDLASLISTARHVNDGQPHFVVELVRRALDGELKGKRIAALGLAFKPDVDDFRESPAVEVVKLLVEAGVEVKGYDPYLNGLQIPGVPLYTELAPAVKDADLLLVLVAHKELCNLEIDRLQEMTPARKILDTVNISGNKNFEQSGFVLYKLGVNRRTQ